MLCSLPSVASAQQTGSFGSLGSSGAGSIVAPEGEAEDQPEEDSEESPEEAPNGEAQSVHEAELIATFNDWMIAYVENLNGPGFYVPPTTRDPELSRLAQIGAERTVMQFTEFMARESRDPWRYFRHEPILDEEQRRTYHEGALCGPESMTVAQIMEAWEQRGPNPGVLYRGGSYLGLHLIGVGHATAGGYACSYTVAWG